jgi:O-antigen ligase
MSVLSAASVRTPARTGWGERRLLPALALLAALVVIAGLVKAAPSQYGVILFAGSVGVIALIYCASRPMLAVVLLLLVVYFYIGLDDMLPVSLYYPVFFAVVLAASLWWMRNPEDRPRIGFVEIVIAMYIGWNLLSMGLPHRYPAIDPIGGQTIAVSSFVVVGVALPPTMLLIGRHIRYSANAIRALLWSLTVLTGYTAVASIMQIRGLGSMVWPRYTADVAGWRGRAGGVFDQPVTNGMFMTLGFAVALLVASRASEPAAARWFARLVAPLAAVGVYITYTRASWLVFALVCVLGAVYAKGFRSGFVSALGVGLAFVALNWSSFTSSDRRAGGVGSANEVDDRLNGIATSIWAFREEPLTGWGIGRFGAINTYNHQQWSEHVPWIRGLGIPSHFNELGILAELGVIGLGLWLAIIGAIVSLTVRALRRLPATTLSGKPYALIAVIGLLVVIIGGLTVDLRYLRFISELVLFLAGIAIGAADRTAEPAGIDTTEQRTERVSIG